MLGVEAAGRGIETGEHAATLTAGSKGVLHGSASYVLQDKYGQVLPTHSVSAGLDYPGVGPEHAYLKEIGRAEYVAITDKGGPRRLPMDGADGKGLSPRWRRRTRSRRSGSLRQLWARTRLSW